MHRRTKTKIPFDNREMQLRNEELWNTFLDSIEKSVLFHAWTDDRIHFDFTGTVDSLGTQVIQITDGLSLMCRIRNKSIFSVDWREM